jgi:trimeric autotransporter adhesin
MRTPSVRALLGAVVALGLVGGAVSYAVGPASATGAALPGGTGLSVGIDSPADGAVLPPGPVTVSGTASVGAGVGPANTAVIFVLGLTVGANGDAGPFAGACPGLNTILDCAKTYVSTLNTAAVDGGGVSSVGVTSYAESSLAADVGPATGQQLITGPATDADGSGSRDVVQVAFSAFADQAADTTEISGFDLYDVRFMLLRDTAVDAGIRSAVQLAQAAGKPNTIVAFLSDGVVPHPDAVATALDQVPAGVHFYPYSIGANALCAGSLRLMADRTGGKCGTPKNRFGDGNHTIFGDDGLGDLPDILRNLRASRLTSLTTSVDGAAPQPVTGTTPALPARGPASVTYSTTLSNLTPGRHQLCVTATGSDSGGTGTATDCRTVVIDTPPTGSLALTAAISPPVATVGGPPLTLTYTLSNDSKVAMPGVQLTTKFPASLSPAGDETCRPNTTCDLGTLQPAQRRTVQFNIPANRAVDDKVSASVTTTGPDSNPADNFAAVRVQILPRQATSTG